MLGLKQGGICGCTAGCRAYDNGHMQGDWIGNEWDNIAIDRNEDADINPE